MELFFTKRLFTVISIFCINPAIMAQNDGYSTEIGAQRAELNREFTDPKTSPLTEEDHATFKGLAFYPIDSRYNIEAHFVRTKGEKPFKMPTSTDRTPRYVKYGEAHFELDGKNHVLFIYQNLELAGLEEYKNHLFLPFFDLTNGEESYGGGRYLDIEKPVGETINIDFNKAYNPYCAYNYKYSCPIPPPENKLAVEIKAGVKDFK